MRLLVIANLYPPYSVGRLEERTRLVVEGLRARGHTVDVLTSDFVRGASLPAYEPTVRRVLGISGLLDLPPGGLVEQRARESHNRRQTRELLRRRRTEAVILGPQSGLGLGPARVVLESGLPVAWDFADAALARFVETDPWLASWHGPAGLTWSATRAALRALGGVLGGRGRGTARPALAEVPAAVFATPAVRDALATALGGAPPGVVSPGPVAAESSPVRPTGRPVRRIVWVGRLNSEHDPRTALEAFVRLRRAGHEELSLDFIVRGESAFERELAEQARRDGVDDAVHFRSVAPERRAAMLADHDLAWVTRRAGSGASAEALEAMAAGLPVLLADGNGLAAWVRPGEDALVLPGGLPSAWAEATAALVTDPSAAAALGSAARARILAECDVAPWTRRLEETLLAKPRAGT